MSGRLTTTVSPVDDVVDDVAVHRRLDDLVAALDLAQHPQQLAGVVPLGEALAVHQPALVEHPVRVEEPVGGDQVDLRMVGPLGEQRLEDAGERALADGDAAGDADDVRHLRGDGAEERRRHLVQVLRGADVQVEQPAERQVDGGHLVEVDVVVDALQPREIRRPQRHRRRGAQLRPLVALEGEVPTESAAECVPGVLDTEASVTAATLDADRVGSPGDTGGSA